MALARFYQRYRQDGRSGVAYEVSMMVALLLYAYCVGECLSRRIAQLCERDVAFRIAAANQVPDHVTIARFNRDNITSLAPLFHDVLRMRKEAGPLKVGVLAVDGIKIKANAALDANRPHEGLTKEIQGILSEAERIDAEEDRQFGVDKRGDELPPELQGCEGGLARLRTAKERLEKEAADEAATKERQNTRCEAELAARDKKVRGRKPKKPDPTLDKEARADPIPKSLDVKGWMARKLLTKGGRTFYKQRSVVIEPIFEQTKDTRGYNTFLMHGFHLADGEWQLACTTHDMLKLFRSLTRRLR